MTADHLKLKRQQRETILTLISGRLIFQWISLSISPPCIGQLVSATGSLHISLLCHQRAALGRSNSHNGLTTSYPLYRKPRLGGCNTPCLKDIPVAEPGGGGVSLSVGMIMIHIMNIAADLDPIPSPTLKNSGPAGWSHTDTIVNLLHVCWGLNVVADGVDGIFTEIIRNRPESTEIYQDQNDLKYRKPNVTSFSPKPARCPCMFSSQFDTRWQWGASSPQRKDR